MENDIVNIPRDYAELLGSLKERIRSAQVKAALSVNREMVLLYCQIGREILERQASAGWGAKIIERLSDDLRSEFPEMKGFSLRNLIFMRGFAEAFPDDSFVKQLVSQIPWGHIIRTIQMIKNPIEREWYMRKTIEHGWSRPLAHISEDGRCHNLYDHLKGTAKLAAEFAGEFECAVWGRLAGLWHDPTY